MHGSNRSYGWSTRSSESASALHASGSLRLCISGSPESRCDDAPWTASRAGFPVTCWSLLVWRLVVKIRLWLQNTLQFIAFSGHQAFLTREALQQIALIIQSPNQYCLPWSGWKDRSDPIG